VKGEEEGVMVLGDGYGGVLLDILMAMRPLRALPELFLSGGEKKIKGESASSHNPGSSCIETPLTAILLYHSIIPNYN
jgi:hypothetical protein